MLDNKKVKLINIINGLDTGGAEMMLYKVLSEIERSIFCPVVVSLTDIGEIGVKIQSLGINVYALEMKREVPNPLALVHLIKLLRAERPCVIQTWMYHADFLGGLTARAFTNMPVIWNIRHSNLEPEVNKARTLKLVKACAKLSGIIPCKIVCCSRASMGIHVEFGYREDRMIIIPNGFNLNDFKLDRNAGYSVRRKFGIPEDAVLIGNAGRFHPQKDHKNFIEAAAIICSEFPQAYFALCGEDINNDNHLLVELINGLNIQDRCYLLDKMEDMRSFYSALDLFVLSSCGEGFPNVVGEAMSCQIPCVVTDVGDSAAIVKDTGKVVPPKNPFALAMAIREFLMMDESGKRNIGINARLRIDKNFSLGAVVKKYEGLYKEAAGFVWSDRIY